MFMPVFPWENAVILEVATSVTFPIVVRSEYRLVRALVPPVTSDMNASHAWFSADTFVCCISACTETALMSFASVVPV